VLKSALLNQAACHLKLGANRDAMTAANKVQAALPGESLITVFLERSKELLRDQAAGHLKLGTSREAISPSTQFALIQEIFLTFHSHV